MISNIKSIKKKYFIFKYIFIKTVERERSKFQIRVFIIKESFVISQMNYEKNQFRVRII